MLSCTLYLYKILFKKDNFSLLSMLLILDKQKLTKRKQSFSGKMSFEYKITLQPKIV